MNSIYIESKTLYQNKPAVEWLDKCGARWVDGTPFEDYRTRQPYICFTKDGFAHFPSSMKPDTQNDTHTPTAFEFCQGVARILGIPEPTFAEDKDKAFWDSEEAIIDRAKNNPVIIDPALYGAKVEPKGMAIEVSLLDRNEKRFIESIYTCPSWNLFKFCICSKSEEIRTLNLGSAEYVEDRGYIITTNPTVFMEYVAQQTGKEYKPVDPQKVLYNREKLLTILKEPLTEEELKTLMEMRVPNFPEHDFDSLIKTYPHKTYRILDSLDGIPLDTRIPLSEWIPPYKSSVIVMKEDWFFRGVFYAIVEDGVEFKDESETIVLINFDGEWMRIV